MSIQGKIPNRTKYERQKANLRRIVASLTTVVCEQCKCVIAEEEAYRDEVGNECLYFCDIDCSIMYWRS